MRYCLSESTFMNYPTNYISYKTRIDNNKRHRNKKIFTVFQQHTIWIHYRSENIKIPHLTSEGANYIRSPIQSSLFPITFIIIIIIIDPTEQFRIHQTSENIQIPSWFWLKENAISFHEPYNFDCNASSFKYVTNPDFFLLINWINCL